MKQKSISCVGTNLRHVVPCMKIVISWSGAMSGAIAEEMRDWLPKVLPFVETWMSEKDIDKGSVWIVKILSNLENAQGGLLCLTPQNLKAPWIHFEAGTLLGKLVYPFLFGVSPTKLGPPLSCFQVTRAVREDTQELVRAINKAAGECGLPELIVDLLFDRYWPFLEKHLNVIACQSNLNRKLERIVHSFLTGGFKLFTGLWFGVP